MLAIFGIGMTELIILGLIAGMIVIPIIVTVIVVVAVAGKPRRD